MDTTNITTRRNEIDHQLRQFPTYRPGSFQFTDFGAEWVFSNVLMHPEPLVLWVRNPIVRLDDVRTEVHVGHGEVAMFGEGYDRLWGTVPHPHVLIGNRPQLKDPAAVKRAIKAQDWPTVFRLLLEFLSYCNSMEGLDVFFEIKDVWKLIEQDGQLLTPDGRNVIIEGEGDVREV